MRFVIRFGLAVLTVLAIARYLDTPRADISALAYPGCSAERLTQELIASSR